MGEWLDAVGEWLAVWSSYRPRNLLMFAPRTYWRLFELHNAAWWPLHAGTLAAGLAAMRSLTKATARHLVLVLAGLAAACAFVGWAFVFERYGSINWAAHGWAWVYGLLALALLGLAAQRPEPVARPLARRAGLALLGWALFGQPLLAPLAGRTWQAAEVFGLAPDPTVMAALGALLLTAGPSPQAPRLARWAGTSARSLALCALAGSAATLATMRQWEAIAPAAAGVLALATMVLGGRSRRARPAAG